MIGLDTSILIRYLTQDDPIHSPRATDLIEHRLTIDNPGFISMVAMVETVWVLGRAYRFGDLEVAEVVEGLLKASVFVVENEVEVFAAMTALREGLGSFPDVLIGALGEKAGCSVTLTFDREASRLPRFALA